MIITPDTTLTEEQLQQLPHRFQVYYKNREIIEFLTKSKLTLVI